MAVYYPYNIQCSCGHKFTVQLARSINAGRVPEIKKLIMAGKFHKVQCSSCNRTFIVEKEFSYSDFTTNTFIKVKPRQERHSWKETSLKLEKEAEQIPEMLSQQNERTLRVVFGLAELREKLIAQEYDLDDRYVELMKVLLVHDHPFLLKKPRLRITLNKISDTSIDYIATYDHDDVKYELKLPRWVVDNFLSKEEEIKSWVKSNHYENIFDLKNDYWINIWRWSPQPGALQLLKSYSGEIKKGKDVDTTHRDFENMLTHLPRGSQLPAWAKEDLQVLFNYAKAQGLNSLEDILFEIRFDKTLEDDWAFNSDPEDIDTLWKLLKDLPETNVEGNSFVDNILLDEGNSGGSYDPLTYDVFIGSGILSDQENFEDTVRHEIGHAVHEKFKNIVDNWLFTRFGWQMFEASTSGIDNWVNEIGGWGNINAVQQAQIRNFLVECLGLGSSWTAGRPNFIPPGHPWSQPNFAPRLAYESTGDNWYLNYSNWYRYNGKAFFLNYWYRSFCIVNESTLQLIDNMPSNYASMSHFEFFAELYALYFDRDDPMRSRIPHDVMQWFEQNIVTVRPTRMHPQIKRKAFDWIRRPKA